MKKQYNLGDIVMGNWTITRLLGEGGFGKVFEIQRQEFDHVYKAALKIITVPQNESEIKSAMASGMDIANVTEYFEGVARNLISEFALMSKLKGNSNIVSYEDHKVIKHEDKLGWDILIRMELLTPLLDYKQCRDNELAYEEIIKLGIDICKALETCQRRSITHRDIKPENIFISEDGNFKLGDFGIARTIEKTNSGLSKKGTYTFMAPEVYKGEAYGSGVDIYSLGIVMYSLLNHNRTPFLPPFPENIKHSDIDRALIMRISGEKPPAPARGEVRLGEIVLKACAYDPKDRYSSPMQMRQELEAIDDCKGEGKGFFPKRDKSDINPIECEAEEKTDGEEGDGETAHTEGKTVSIFGKVNLGVGKGDQQGSKTDEKKPKKETTLQKNQNCTNCNATMPNKAKFCMGCGSQMNLEFEKSGEKTIPKGSKIPLLMEPGEEIIVQAYGGVIAADEDENIFISSIKGYITLTNRRLVWLTSEDELGGLAVGGEWHAQAELLIKDIATISPWSLDIEGESEKVSIRYSIFVGVEEDRYGFYFDDPDDATLISKREKFINYLCMEKDIPFIHLNDSVVPIYINDGEYIEVQGNGNWAIKSWPETGVITITNKRFIWTKTNWLWSKRKSERDISFCLDDVKKIAHSIDGDKRKDFFIVVKGKKQPEFSLTGNTGGIGRDTYLREWMITFIKEYQKDAKSKGGKQL